MFDFQEREDYVFDEAQFAPYGNKAIPFRDVNIITDNKLMEWGKVGSHENVVGIAIRINGARHGAIPNLEIGTEGTLTATRVTDRVDKEGKTIRIEEVIHSAIVQLCNPQDGSLVLIAASYDHVTTPHSYCAT
jgi:hypothetical protein